MTIEAEAPHALAPAKINLFLHVGEKRADGFHALQSLVAFARYGDDLALSPDRDLRLVLRGPFAQALSGERDNLVLKAARALQEHAGIERGAYLSLRKNLPVASGIGGGSADAAAALRGLSRLWGVTLPPDELLALAAALGSDVPVCMASQPQWMEGRGEKLTAVGRLPALPAVLVHPGVAVSTAGVFAALKTRSGVDLPLPPKMETAAEVIAYLKDTANDLEAPARAIAPVIGAVLSALAAQKGVALARMSGSGATCFGLFDTDDLAALAAIEIGERHPDWWVMATTIGPVSPPLLLA